MLSTPIYSRADRWFGYSNALLAGLMALSIIYPLIYIVSQSLSSGEAVTAGRVFLYPKEFTLAAYEIAMREKMFWISYANTFYYTIFGTLTSLIFIIPGAYALSKQRLRGRRLIGFFVAFTMWFHAGMIPTYLNLRDLDLLDSRFGILIAFAVNAFNLILMRNYFEGISPSFEEAARMDGANDLQILWKVFIPLSKPAIATVTLLCGIGRWNGYFWSMVLLKDEDKIPLQVYLKKMIVDINMTEQVQMHTVYSIETVVAAIMVMSIIPVVIIFPMVQKYFTKGVMMGGVKE